ncbi:hypothetical protein MMC25_007906 [Agyrium rufum]|nr:hypothetical protein [Agyrium rufum]
MRAIMITDALESSRTDHTDTISVVVGPKETVFHTKTGALKKSPVFERMLIGPWKEAQEHRLEFPDDDYSDIGLLLTFLEDGTLPSLRRFSDLPVAVSNDEYEKVKDQYLERLAALYILADRFLVSDLQQGITFIVKMDFLDIMSSPSFFAFISRVPDSVPEKKISDMEDPLRKLLRISLSGLSSAPHLYSELPSAGEDAKEDIDKTRAVLEGGGSWRAIKLYGNVKGYMFRLQSYSRDMAYKFELAKKEVARLKAQLQETREYAGTRIATLERKLVKVKALGQKVAGL